MARLFTNTNGKNNRFSRSLQQRIARLPHAPHEFHGVHARFVCLFVHCIVHCILHCTLSCALSCALHCVCLHCIFLKRARLRWWRREGWRWWLTIGRWWRWLGRRWGFRRASWAGSLCLIIPIRREGAGVGKVSIFEGGGIDLFDFLELQGSTLSSFWLSLKLFLFLIWNQVNEGIVTFIIMATTQLD